MCICRSAGIVIPKQRAYGPAHMHPAGDWMSNRSFSIVVTNTGCSTRSLPDDSTINDKIGSRGAVGDPASMTFGCGRSVHQHLLQLPSPHRPPLVVPVCFEVEDEAHTNGAEDVGCPRLLPLLDAIDVPLVHLGDELHGPSPRESRQGEGKATLEQEDAGGVGPAQQFVHTLRMAASLEAWGSWGDFVESGSQDRAVA